MRNKLLLAVPFCVLLAVPDLSGQAITVKLQVNPVLHIEQKVPLSIGTDIEVGLTARSSLQLSGSYRIDKQLSWGIDQGPKFYLDYRYYCKTDRSRNAGLYLSPFIGYGNLRLAQGDEPTGEIVSH